jgi:hypothetical protein
MLWIFAGLLLGLTGLGLLLLCVPQPPPYAFLAGQSPLGRKPSQQGPNQFVTIYSFPARFRDLCAKAGRELKAKGLSPVVIHWHGRKETAVMYAPFPPIMKSSAARRPTLPKVSLINNTKVSSAVRLTPFGIQPTPANHKEGWITVTIEDTREPTSFEKLRSWLGL